MKVYIKVSCQFKGSCIRQNMNNVLVWNILICFNEIFIENVIPFFLLYWLGHLSLLLLLFILTPKGHLECLHMHSVSLCTADSNMFGFHLPLIMTTWTLGQWFPLGSRVSDSKVVWRTWNDLRTQLHTQSVTHIRTYWSGPPGWASDGEKTSAPPWDVQTDQTNWPWARVSLVIGTDFQLDSRGHLLQMEDLKKSKFDKSFIKYQMCSVLSAQIIVWPFSTLFHVST